MDCDSGQSHWSGVDIAMSRLEPLREKLRTDGISVKSQWIATRQAWRDAAGGRFEREFWQPLEVESIRYLEALKKLSDALQEADINTR